MISVIIPAFNAERTITECLESVERQSYQDFECLLVDDGSCDLTREIAATVASANPRFTVIALPTNKGVSHCRNIGICKAKGEFVFFLDADDFITETALAVLYETASKTKSDYCFSPHLEYTESTGEYRRKTAEFENDTSLAEEGLAYYIRQYLKLPYRYYGLVHCWGRLYRTALIRERGLEFPEDLSQMEDVAFNFSYLEYCQRVDYVHQFLYIHRIPAFGSLGATKGMEPSYDAKLKKAVSAVRHYLLSTLSLSELEAEQQIGHLYSSMTIIALLRMSKQFFAHPGLSLYCKVRYLIRSELTQTAFRSYRPEPGDSRFIGHAVRWRLAGGVLLVCFLRKLTGMAL